MSRRGKSAGAVCAFVIVVSAGCESPPAESLSTSIRPSDCTEPPQEVAAAFKDRDVGAQQCPAPDGWQLFVVSSDANAWIELRRGSVVWSAEEAIVYEAPVGNFPSVSGSSPLEWRRGPGDVLALILPVAAQNPEDAVSRILRFFVIRLEPARVCLIGRVATAEAARALADGPGACQATAGLRFTPMDPGRPVELFGSRPPAGDKR